MISRYEFIKREKYIKFVAEDDEGSFNITTNFYCFRCGISNCIHVIEVTEKILFDKEELK